MTKLSQKLKKKSPNSRTKLPQRNSSIKPYEDASEIINEDLPSIDKGQQDVLTTIHTNHSFMNSNQGK